MVSNDWVAQSLHLVSKITNGLQNKASVEGLKEGVEREGGKEGRAEYRRIWTIY